MRGFQRTRGLHDDVRHHVGVHHAVFLDYFLHGLPFDELHAEVQQIAVLTKVVNLRDIGVADQAGVLRLTIEPLN